MNAGPQKIPEAAQCLGCDYQLRDLPELRCPECGREFDPSDPDTFRGEPRVPKWVRSFAQPPSKSFNHTCTVLAVLTLLAFAWPGGVAPLLAIAPCGFMFFALAWFFSACIRTVLRAVFHKQGRMPRPLPWRYLHAPIVFTIVIVAVVSKLPSRLYLVISWPLMQRHVGLARETPAELPKEGWVGLYPADAIQVEPGGGFRFRIPYSGLLYPEGIVYSPAGRPSQAWGGTYLPLIGDWYRWRLDWD
jgi:hypothetical protein